MRLPAVRQLQLRSAGVAALLCAAALPALPHTAEAAAPSRVELELSPTGREAYPHLRAERGETVHSRVRVTNSARRSRVVLLQALDAMTAASGGPDFRALRTPRTAGWVRLQHRELRLAAGEARTVAFVTRVPRDARAGEHYAGIVAVDREELRRAAAVPGRRGTSVVVRHVTRLALPLKVTVPGAASRTVTAGAPELESDASGARIDLPLHNTGGLLVRSARVDLEVRRGSDDKPLFRERTRLAELMPGTGLRHALRWQGQPAEGDYHVVGTVRPKGAAPIAVDQHVEFTRARAKHVEQITGKAVAPGSSVPVALVAGLAAALLLAGAASVGYLRMRRRMRTLAAAS